MPGVAVQDDDAGVMDEVAVDTDEPTSAAPQVDDPALEQAGWSALRDWAALPSFEDSVPQVFSTHERDGDDFSLIDTGNKDFNSFLAVCGAQPTTIDQQNDASVACGPGQVGYLIAADDGPGYVSRILLARGVTDPTSSILTNLRPNAERVRIYIDGQENPVYDGAWSAWGAAQAPPFDAPLTGWTAGATVSYLPISYQSQLRVFVDELQTSPVLYYAQVNVQRGKETAPVDLDFLASVEARAQLDALVSQAEDSGAVWFDGAVSLEGSGAWTVWSRELAGTLQSVEIAVEPADAEAILHETTLRLSWDGGAPAVNLPLAVLFAADQELGAFSTLPLSVQLDANVARLKLTLPMPFSKSARLELVHDTSATRTLQLRLKGADELPRGEWGRLHAAFSEHRDPQPGERFRVAALSGRGKYVGTVLYVLGRADASGRVRASELGFLEGDDRLEIDGVVAGLGTGTDNYFNGGFYFGDGAYDSWFAAVPQLTTDDSAETSEATLVRWNILSDALSFRQRFELSFEFGADRPATVRRYAAVSYYYQ